MKYKVHKLEINLGKEHDRLEQFLNNLNGEVVSILPEIKTFFLFYGAKSTTIMIVEKVKK